ncbi:hypothetical protein T07_3939 [Trichinella nelsoni]|uniref:Uncharacterized protein n=1 Tax=Trichinella nelsoni TaxID=6336 RepID=A0A0V0RBJ8_9BILA|nr:hypothetical protein T07_3939 [Trichinella nelsoni]
MIRACNLHALILLHDDCTLTDIGDKQALSKPFLENFNEHECKLAFPMYFSCTRKKGKHYNNVIAMFIVL